MTLEEIVKRHHLTDVQLNCEIRDGDIPRLAKYFDKVELYPKLMNLNPAEEQDVVDTLHANGNQVAMSKCLSLWKEHDSFKATYEALLEVLLKLDKGEIANNVCLYLAAKNGRLYIEYACMVCTCMYSALLIVNYAYREQWSVDSRLVIIRS